MSESAYLSNEGLSAYNVSILEETVYELNKGEDEFKNYFEAAGEKKKIYIMDRIIELEDIVIPTIKQWLEKNYFPIVNAGIIGVGKNL